MIALMVFIIAVVRSSLGFLGNDNCILAVRQRNPNRTSFNKFVGLMTRLTDPALLKEDGYYEEDCAGWETFKGCQTFSCKDSNDNDLFVFNDCVVKGPKCTPELDNICSELSGEPKCRTCRLGNCNKHRLELKTPNLGTKAEDLISTVAGESSTDGTANKLLSASPDFRLHFGAKRPPSNGAAGATLYSSTTSLLLFPVLLL